MKVKTKLWEIEKGRLLKVRIFNVRFQEKKFESEPRTSKLGIRPLALYVSVHTITSFILKIQTQF